MAVWDDVVLKQDRAVFEKSGLGLNPEFGKSPALIIVDVTYNFVGDKLEPILESMDRYPLSCGEAGWQAIDSIAVLLPLARQKNMPIIYSTSDTKLPPSWRKSARCRKERRKIPGGNDIVKEIAPSDDDLVITKLAPSVFFGTSLASILLSLAVDTLFFCGCTTSGCVRASVVDAASWGFRVSVIEEGTFDRCEISHKISLFDMNWKYGAVISATRFKDYLTML